MQSKRKRIDSYFVSNVADDCAAVATRRDWLRAQFPYDSVKHRVASASRFYAEFDKLNDRQLAALLRVRQGKKLFLTGSAGTGKTLWMTVAIAMLQSMGKSVAVTATTARAAANISVLTVDSLPPFELSNRRGGKKQKVDGKPKNIWDVVPRTLHSFAGCGIDEFDPVQLGAEMKTKGKYIYAKNRWLYCNVLFIDEVSMLHPKLFAALDLLAQVVRGNSRPWGGIQLICVADFFQLPPVDKQRLNIGVNTPASLALANDSENDDDASESFARFSHAQTSTQMQMQSAESAQSAEESLLVPIDAANARYCFQTIEWHQTIDASVLLDEIYRQSNAEFIDLLCQLRRGKLSDENISLLQMRTRYRLKDDLLNVAHAEFGAQGCVNVSAIAEEMLDVLLEQPDVSLEKLLETCQVDADENMWFRSGFVPESMRKETKANWPAVHYYLQTCSKTSFDASEALIRALPPNTVPETHQIMVSRIRPTFIMSRNDQVQECNVRNLDAIRQSRVEYNANIKIELHQSSVYYQEAQRHFADVFTKNNNAPLNLQLKVGAQVLLTANLKPPRFINGRRGIVVDFLTEKEYFEAYGDDAIYLGSGEQLDSLTPHVKMPVVEFEGPVYARVGLHCWESKKSFGKRPPTVAQLRQVPLILAFAITIHRSQGMTIDCLSVNLTGAFESGLPYVALSRAVSLERLIVEELQRDVFDGSNKKLLPPPEVEALYAKLERDTEQELQTLCAL